VIKHSRALAVRCEARTTTATIRVVRAFVAPADHVCDRRRVARARLRVRLQLI